MRCSLIAVAALFAIAFAEGNDTCTSCVLDGRKWCGATQTCMGLTDYCAQCGKVDVSACPTVDRCDAVTNCAACTAASCLWCADTNSCVEKNANGKICAIDTPDCVKCARSGLTADSRCFPLNGTQCSEQKDCYSCTSNGCGWCSDAQTCMDYDHLNRRKPFCDASDCASCMRYSTTDCPAKNCPAQRNCRDCTLAGCGWCAATQECMEVDPITDLPCSPSTCQSCLKTAPTTCPASICPLQTSCSTCAMAGCLWCESSKSCTEATATGDHQCWGVCFEGFTTDCGCPKRSNCSSCTSWKEGDMGCGWCDHGAGANGTCLLGSSYSSRGLCKVDVETGVGLWNFTADSCYSVPWWPHWFEGAAFVGMFFMTGLIFGVWGIVIFCRWRRSRAHVVLHV